MAFSHLLPPLFVAVCFLYLLYRWAMPKPLPGIPHTAKGPTRLLGDLPELAAHYTKHNQTLPWFASLCAELKTPILQVFAKPFVRPFVILNDYRETVDIVTRRTAEFDRAPETITFFEGFVAHSTIVRRTDALFKAQRRLWAGVMANDFLDNVASRRIEKAGADLVDLWTRKAKMAQGIPFEAQVDLRHAALDAIWTMLIGSELGGLQSQLDVVSASASAPVETDARGAAVLPQGPLPRLYTSIDTILRSLAQIMVSPAPAWHHFLIRQMPYYRRANNYKSNVMRTIINEAKKSYATQKTRHITCAMDLVLSREAAAMTRTGAAFAEGADEAQLMDELFMLVLAGHETTATTLAWGLKHLAENPDVQSALRKALQDTWPHTKMPSHSEIAKADVPYLDAASAEILRVARTTAAVVRRAMVDTTILGCKVPAGTSVICLTSGFDYLYGTDFSVDEKLRSPSSRGEDRQWDIRDIHAFKPSRWLREEEGRTVFDGTAGPSLPFSAGPRGCFGKRMAWLELKMLLTMIILNFELLPTPEALSGHDAKECLTRQVVDCFVSLRVL